MSSQQWVVPNNKFHNEARTYGAFRGELCVPALGCTMRSEGSGNNDADTALWIVKQRKVGGKFNWVTHIQLAKVVHVRDDEVCVDPTQTLEIVPGRTAANLYWRNDRNEVFRPV